MASSIPGSLAGSGLQFVLLLSVGGWGGLWDKQQHRPSAGANEGWSVSGPSSGAWELCSAGTPGSAWFTLNSIIMR